jgi:hypothetical protein
MPLTDYKDINSKTKANLLLGNGFSMGVSQNFGYRSLYEALEKLKKENKLSLAGNEINAKTSILDLFKQFDTYNFEFILNRLSIAISVNKILTGDDNRLQAKYDIVREALLEVVTKIHPTYESIKNEQDTKILNWMRGPCLEEFKNFSNIFTVNYDSLIYWIIRQEFKLFRDYFWSTKQGEIGTLFDLSDTRIKHNRIPVHYLHGALFIFKNTDDGRIEKIKSKEDSLLKSVEDAMKKNNNYIPIFISEGNSQESKVYERSKIGEINSNEYLHFVFSKFLKIEEGITIFGHSLSEYDQHIIDAINNNEKLKYIAISIYPRRKKEEKIVSKTDKEIEKEMAKIKDKLNIFCEKEGNNIEFFDSEKSPLASPSQI